MGLQVENALPDGFSFQQAHRVMYGTRTGMDFLILPMDTENQYQIQFYTDLEKSMDKDGFMDFLGNMYKRYPFIHHAGYNGNNMVSIYVRSEGDADKANLTAALSELSGKCVEHGLKNCCAHCKNTVSLHTAAVDNTPLMICDNCLSQLNDRMEGQRARKENILLGCIGAIVGVLLGSAVWILIGQIGFIAGIAGFAIVFGGMKGYEILGGKLTKKGIVICVLLSFIVILAAEFASIGIAVYREFSKVYEVTVSDAFGVIPEFLKDPEMAAEVAKDLIIGYILAIWASYANVKSAWRKVDEDPAQHTVERF